MVSRTGGTTHLADRCVPGQVRGLLFESLADSARFVQWPPLLVESFICITYRRRPFIFPTPANEASEKPVLYSTTPAM